MSLSACSSSRESRPLRSSKYLPDGIVLISRPIPNVAPASEQQMLAFMPVGPKHSGSWLSIRRESSEVRLMDGDRVVRQYQADGLEGLSPGVFQVVHKQENAPWYAPTAYFKQRKLPVPPEGHKSRYLRGALGDHVLYFSNQIPIHSGPIALAEIGGIKLDDAGLSVLFQHLGTGSTIEIR